jgi:double-stranded uracil-DNA glycosylase
VILPLFSTGLRVVFWGTAAGTASAMASAYYAGPGNRFWSILHESGLAPRRLAPSEFRLLPECGIGLTDVCKTRMA